MTMEQYGFGTFNCKHPLPFPSKIVHMPTLTTSLPLHNTSTYEAMRMLQNSCLAQVTKEKLMFGKSSSRKYSPKLTHEFYHSPQLKFSYFLD